jgi:hypothetical protein
MSGYRRVLGYRSNDQVLGLMKSEVCISHQNVTKLSVTILESLFAECP